MRSKLPMHAFFNIIQFGLKISDEIVHCNRFSKFLPYAFLAFLAYQWQFFLVVTENLSSIFATPLFGNGCDYCVVVKIPWQSREGPLMSSRIHVSMNCLWRKSGVPFGTADWISCAQGGQWRGTVFIIGRELIHCFSLTFWEFAVTTNKFKPSSMYQNFLWIKLRMSHKQVKWNLVRYCNGWFYGGWRSWLKIFKRLKLDWCAFIYKLTYRWVILKFYAYLAYLFQ